MILPNQLNKCGCNLFLISFLSPVSHVLVNGWMVHIFHPSSSLKTLLEKEKYFQMLIIWFLIGQK